MIASTMSCLQTRKPLRFQLFHESTLQILSRNFYDLQFSISYLDVISSSLHIHASTSETVRCIHPSAYAASFMISSNGALNGTGAPCNIGVASIASLLLVNKEGIIVFSAEPRVWTSRFIVMGGTKDWMILNDPSSVGAFGDEGTYTRNGICFNAVEGFKRILLVLLKASKSSVACQFAILEWKVMDPTI